MKFHLLVAVASFLLLLAGDYGAATKSPATEDDLAGKAREEFRDEKFSDAERDFREIVKRQPSDIDAQVMLGNCLFRQEKYQEAIIPYERARELQRHAKVLSLDQRRILGDQLAMAYGMSGQLAKARSLLEDSIRQDPDYGLNYYNLACAFAESGDEDKMLANLSLAIKHRDQMVKGEQLPDPRSDPSFKKYLGEERFLTLMRDSGYK
ncbi:MAG: tetratricopeptide repeat protein [Terriglobia bacterium]